MKIQIQITVTVIIVMWGIKVGEFPDYLSDSAISFSRRASLHEVNSLCVLYELLQM
jgi:hypothetical protein